MATTRQRFEDYLESVRARLATDPRVVGLVGMGSTAERWRVDEWSDHDLAIIVTAGAEEDFRRGRSWLPDAERLVIDVVEWHGGVKLVFDDARVIEIGVATTDSIRTWAVHHQDVLLDRGGVADAVADAIRQPERELALRLLALLETQFGDREEYPRAGADAVRARLTAP